MSETQASQLLPFYKYEGAGNDFIIAPRVLSRYGQQAPGWLGLAPDLAATLCNRHVGIGADGVPILRRSSGETWDLRILNADGSEAQMCGNGIRCAALYLTDQYALGGAPLRFQTLVGRREVIRHPEHPAVFTVSMGPPAWLAQQIPTTLC